MTPELTALALACLLQVAQFVIFAIPANIELGPRYTAGPRDEPPKPLSTRTGRLQRALNNHFEALILFTIAVLVVTLGDQSTALTRTCAWIYLAARIAYVPAYVSGIYMLRSVIWGVGLFATVIMLIAALI